MMPGRRDELVTDHVIDEQPGSRFSGRTAWARSMQTPLRGFLRTETGGAAVLLAATIVALLWANIDASSYESLWSKTLSITLGSRASHSICVAG